MDLQYILSPLVSFPSQSQQTSSNHMERDSDGKVASTQLPVRFEQCSVPLGTMVDTPQVSVRAFKQVNPNPEDSGFSFVDSMTCAFQKAPKVSTQSPLDPHAEDFLREVLGPQKWEIFSARLFERRLKAKGRGKGKPGADDNDSKSSISAIEFLVKVEVVKEILRTYVPHPYNPLKSLAHPYSRAPLGQVTLSRSTVLQLSGWSNTQFSYWARRSEALSVLSDYDSRLKAVGSALERRLRDNISLSDEGDDDDEVAMVTGKGLDAIVDEVKKRTGKSQFLRGKHSSLDPYGTALPEEDQAQPFAPPPHLFTMTTMQIDRYIPWKRTEYPRPVTPPPNPQPASTPSAIRRRFPLITSQPLQLESLNDSRAGAMQRNKVGTCTADSDTTLGMNRQSDALDITFQHNFPVSNSRSEPEAPSSKRKPGENIKGAISDSQKRPRTLSDDEI